MSLARKLSALCVAAGLLLVSTGGRSEQKAAAPDCVTARTEAVYRNYGYDHLVHIDNACDKIAHCSVKTSVNPQSIDVDVPAKRTITVLTFRGSPASEFTAEVRCVLDR